MRRLGLAAGLGYLAGTLPASDIASRLAARAQGTIVDLRRTGTGNPGALNAAKSLGLGWGGLVLAVDIAKGWAGSTLGRKVGGDNGAYAAGFATVLGHCFPLWQGFKGGKGVAASAGACLACFPVYFLVDLAVAGVGLAASKRTEKATYISSAMFVVAALTWHIKGWSNGPGPQPTVGLPLFAAATTALIYHRFLTSTSNTIGVPIGGT